VELSRRAVGVATWRYGGMEVWSSKTLKVRCGLGDVEAWR